MEVGVHIFAEHGLSGFQIAVNDALDGFTQERLVFHGNNRSFPDADLETVDAILLPPVARMHLLAIRMAQADRSQFAGSIRKPA